MKKILKRMGKILIIAALLLMLLDLGLHLLARTQWLNERVENALQSALGRQVELGPLTANLSGISVADLKIAEPGGFEKGTFVTARKLRLRFSLIHLLHGHVQVNALTLSGVTAQVAISADGTPSWTDLITAPEEAAATPENTSTSVPFDLTIKRIRLADLHLIYLDEQAPRTLDISDLTLDVKHFSLSHEFPVRLVAQFSHQEPDFERAIALTLKARVHLAQLDLPNAYIHIEALKTYYQKSSVTLSGQITDFVNPQADLKMTVRHLSADMLPGAADKVSFDLPRADASVQAALDTQKQTLTLTRASLQAPGLDVQAQGNLNYASALTYDVGAEVNLVLGEMGRWLTSLADPYQLVGSVQGEFSATQQAAQAQITLAEIGGLLAQGSRMSNVNGQITAQESMDFKTGNADLTVNGKLNGSPFKLSLKITQTAEKITALLDAYAQEIVLSVREQSAQAAQQESPAVAPTSHGAWPLPPAELKAKVQIDHLDVPYFWGKDILFTSDVEGITPHLDQAHGTLRLITGEGKIQDIYKLTDANPLTKVLFLSLNVTGKVFNSLNVLGVLNSLGSGVVSVVSKGNKEGEKAVKTQTVLGPDGAPLEVVVEETDKKVSGEMEYDKFDTQVDFVHGLATIKEGTFVSPMMSFRLDGTADFNSGALNMKVHAAPGRHEVDGMMPLSLKIGGTVDEPQGDMQVLGSVTSLMKQTVTNNVVSRNVTKGVKSIFGLFKKKEEPQETAAELTTQPQEPPAEPAISPNIDESHPL